MGTSTPGDHPPIKATFDRNPDKLPFFLNLVWAHLDHYTIAYTNDRVMVNAIAANLNLKQRC